MSTHTDTNRMLIFIFSLGCLQKLLRLKLADLMMFTRQTGFRGRYWQHLDSICAKL